MWFTCCYALVAVKLSLPFNRSTKTFLFFCAWLIINILKNKSKIIEKRLGYLKQKYYL